MKLSAVPIILLFVEPKTWVAGSVTTTIDFEGFSAGDIVTELTGGIRVTSKPGKRAMIFNSSNPTGGDFDLETSDQGNILIISEDKNASNPDDREKGGTLRFEFPQPVELRSVGLLDVEEGALFTMFDANNTEVVKINDPSGRPDGNYKLMSLNNTSGVKLLDVRLKGSGAITSLSFVPPPGAIDLVMRARTVGPVCESLNKPKKLTFQYIPGSTVDTKQGQKAAITMEDEVEFASTPCETAYVVVFGKKSSIYFADWVECGAEFTILTTNKFESSITISFSNSQREQRVVYHTSCSVPMMLGDRIGSAKLVASDVSNYEPSLEDANVNSTAAEKTVVQPDDRIVLTMTVTNTGPLPICHVNVHLLADKVKLYPVQFLSGDADGCLGPQETWLYTETIRMTEVAKGWVVGTDIYGNALSDSVPAVFDVQRPSFCECGRPKKLTFRYQPGNDLVVGALQIEKGASVDGVLGPAAEDGAVYLVVSGERVLKEDPSNDPPTRSFGSSSSTRSSKSKRSGKKKSSSTDNYFEDWSSPDDEIVLDKFSSDVLHFSLFDEDGNLLQTMTYWIGCRGVPMHAGDVIGSMVTMPLERDSKCTK